MKGFLRRVRGAFGTALTWAMTWSGASVAMTLVTFFLWRQPLPATTSLLAVLGMTALGTGISGFVTGLLFSAYVGLSQRNRSILEIRGLRFAFGGFVTAALAYPAIMIGTSLALTGTLFDYFPAVLSGIMLPIALRSGILGALSATWTLRVAKRESRRLAKGDVDRLQAEQDEVAALLGSR